MKNFLLPKNWPARARQTVLALVLICVTFSGSSVYGGNSTAFYIDANNYSAPDNGSGSVTLRVSREVVSGPLNDWNPAASAQVLIYINQSGTYPIWVSDVPPAWQGGSYLVTIPANYYYANVTVPISLNTNVYYDRTGTFTVGNNSGVNPNTGYTTATLTVLDANTHVGVAYYAGGNYYNGYQILEAGTNGGNSVDVRFLRDYGVSARTVNYNLTGSTASGGTDYTPALGTVTFPFGSNYVDTVISANNASQTTNKALIINIASGNYQTYPGFGSATNIIAVPAVAVLFTNINLVEGGINGANASKIRFIRSFVQNQTLTVNYNLTGSTATGGTDYTPSLGAVTIPSGASETDINISANNPSQTTNKILTINLTGGDYQTWAGYGSATATIQSDYPGIGVSASSPTMTRNETTSTLTFYANTYFPGYSQARTVNYTLSGSTAANGVDFTPSLSGSITIPAGQGSVSTILTPAVNLAGTKILNVSLTGGYYTILTNANPATIGILEDAPMVNVLASGPAQYAYQNGPAGQFSLTRSGELTKSITVNYSVSGTAVSGVNYAALPASVTFAANQTATNLTVTATGTPALTNAATVVFTLNTNANYVLGANSQAVVTLLPNRDTTNSVPSPVGRYWRGSGSDPTYWSQVVPVEGEKGTLYDNLNGDAAALYGITCWGSTYYHYNATNSLSQANNANRIAFNNPIVAFGERVGGTPLYLNQLYSLGVSAGDLVDVASPVQIVVYNRTNFSVAGYINVYPPNGSSQSSWNNYATNGFQVTASTNYLSDGVTVTTNTFGLFTILSDSPDLNWGTTSRGAYLLTHTATAQATNYYYLVQSYGYVDSLGTPMAQSSGNQIAPSELYTIEFEQRPLWRSVFLDQPQFDGSPLPPFYAGKTLAEMLTNTPPVTNLVSFSPSAATNLNDSPELRRHPILDNFAASMGNDPIALANYVINNIDLTDPMDYSDNGNVAEQSINPGGVSRGALGAFMEKQGSPLDQCALLVYLLRQAGVPAVYEFPPRNGLQILDARLSRMLKFQVHGGYSEAGQLYTTNTMIPVNYPWVAAYIGTNWVHIFPWLKDYDIVEGLNLYDEMPTNYSNAYGWVHDYVYGNSNLLSLAVDGDNTPRVVFPAFLKQTLLQNHPGISVDDLGVEVYNRQHYYSRWQDFPTPTWVTNVSTSLESLTDPNLAGISPTLTNIFDTISVEIYSSTDPTKDIQTGDMRLCDLHDREFYIYQTATNSSQILMNLVLLPYSTNITTQAAFTNDANLLSKETLSLLFDQFDDQLNVRFNYKRHRALAAAYAIDPYLAFLGLSADRQEIWERPLRKGDQAAICMSYGNITRDMLNLHATDIWQMENAVQANPALTNTLSPDVYEGATMYLAGMSYYHKVAEFDQLNQHLHKINNLSFFAAGLSKISPARDSSGNLTNNQVYPVLPNVDMFFYEVASVGNGTVQPNSGQNAELADQNYNLIAIADGSAEEHQAVNTFYKQTNAVSTVRLLQLAQSSGADIVALNVNNYATKATNVYQGKPLQSWDSNLWSQVTAAFQNPADASYCTAYITPGPMTNSAYKGMAALILGWSKWQALITPQSLNGAFGQPLYSLMDVSEENAVNYDLDEGDDDNFDMSFDPPLANTTLLPADTPKFQFTSTLDDIQNNTAVMSGFDLIQDNQIANTFNISTAVNPQNNAADFSASQQPGFLGRVEDAVSQTWSEVADPVQTVTGEFYVDETDLTLPGPIPLSLRRNYSSQNLADNQFGAGWKFSIMPYLSVTAGNTNIYAADMDGAVLAYVQSATNANVWIPTLAVNPQLNNNTTAGAGGLVNRLRDRLVQTGNGSTTNYTLYGADGSIRNFQVMTFNNGVLNQTRPYLQKWTDSRGNYYTFTFGTDPSQPSFGEVSRIQCSNGNFLGFDYDIYSHIIDAYCGDGRRLIYDYDQYGDLITVTLPDATTRSYVYQHATQAVTNGSAYYSTHLIVEEDKPDGRVLQNVYDSQRRVTNQLSTAGVDLNPIRTATFVFSNNFNLTNSYTVPITGYTLIIDGNGNTNRYDYVNSLITKVTDPLGQTVQQTWYADNATAPGYPRSISTSTDKRGLVAQYQYDSNGDVTNTVITGDLTGDGITTQTATNTAVFNTNGLPTRLTDADGNSTAVVYDPVYNFLPQQVIRYAGTTPVSTNYTLYGSASTVVTNGSLIQTNVAFGLAVRQVRAFGTADAATNDLAYDGHGFLTQSIRYTGTTDPNVTTAFFYNERGQMVTKMDALGAETFFDYDALNRPIEQENYDEHANTLAWSFNYYNDNGELSWVDGPRYNPEDYVYYDYDGAGRRSTEIHWRSQANPNGTGVEAPSGYNLYAQSFYAYDPLGNLLRSVDPRGAITTNAYNAVAEMVRTTRLDTDGATVLSTESFGYEPGGQVKFHTNALGGVTTTLYTTTGKPEYQSNPDGSTNAWRYDLAGRIVREVQRNGAYWQTIYDDVDRITTRVFCSPGGMGEATNSVQLDRRGNAIQRVDAGNNVFTAAFDGLDRTKVTTGPSILMVSSPTNGLTPPGTNVTYVTNYFQQINTVFYDAAGRSMTNVNALNESTVTTMDALGRTTRVLIYGPSGALVREKYYSYSPDHNSVTVTDGSGQTAISHTTWTDPDGRTVLSAAYPASGWLDYTWNDYDLSGNLAYQEHDTSPGGGWTFASYEYDGLNRRIAETNRDYAVTTYGYDALGDLTRRTIPGGLQWLATFNNAGEEKQDWLLATNGTGTRTNTYTYYASGSSFAGLVNTKTDGRGLVSAYAYDDWLRESFVSRTDPNYNYVTTSWGYDPRGYTTNITEQYAANDIGNYNPKVVLRSFDAYGQLSSETITVGGMPFSSASQAWDPAGRRTGLAINGANYAFNSRPDGALIYASDPTGSGSYGYDSAGLLTNRTVGPRTTSITSRDGEGRPFSITTAINGSQQMTESLVWYGDGTLYSDTLYRPDFTDSRVYSYAGLTRRLTQEQLNLNGTTSWTNTFSYDGGAAGGPGVLTQMRVPGSTSANWIGSISPFSQINTETNNAVSYPALGRVNGQSTISAYLDGHPLSVLTNGTTDPSHPFRWYTTMELTPGAHQLKVAAAHPSGFFTAWATNWFTNSIGSQSVSISRDAGGNVMQRIWRDPNGTQVHQETLYFDAKDRPADIFEVDSGTQNGLYLHSEYDGLNRRLFSTCTVFTNGADLNTSAVTINQYYDPLVEFLELGVSYGTKTEWKLYGPDMNGRYGGLNGTGGLDGVSPYLNTFVSLISDFRGNTLAEVTNNQVAWNSARPTGYGAMPGYRPTALGHGADISLSSAWRGRWPDITGYYQIGMRMYDPVAGMWLSYDSAWNERDPNYLTFCGGDPVNGFDHDGRCVEGGVTAAGNLLYGTAGLVNNTLGTLSYAVSTPFAPDWAYQTYGGNVQGLVNTVTGTAQFGYNVAATATYGAISPFAPDFAYNNYGGNVQQLMGQAPALYGGNNQSTAYQLGYGAVTFGTMLLGGEESEAGTFGTVSDEIAPSSVITDPARLLPAPQQPLALLPETSSAPAAIATPYGQAFQAMTPEAQAALQQVQSGATVYRQGQFGVQNTADAQFWSLNNPATTPGYAGSMGMPAGSAAPDWIMGGTVQPGAPVITRPAPAGPGGVNPGGNIEAVVNPGDVQGSWFHMP